VKACLISLAAGLLVGLAYGAFGIRSPAPPMVALIGLLGMLVGEQMAPMAARLLARGPDVEQVAPVGERSRAKPTDAGERG
jgi:XapX domain-containing protein